MDDDLPSLRSLDYGMMTTVLLRLGFLAQVALLLPFLLLSRHGHYQASFVVANAAAADIETAASGVNNTISNGTAGNASTSSSLVNNTLTHLDGVPPTGTDALGNDPAPAAAEDPGIAREGGDNQTASDDADVNNSTITTDDEEENKDSRQIMDDDDMVVDFDAPKIADDDTTNETAASILRHKDEVSNETTATSMSSDNSASSSYVTTANTSITGNSTTSQPMEMGQEAESIDDVMTTASNESLIDDDEARNRTRLLNNDTMVPTEEVVVETRDYKTETHTTNIVESDEGNPVLETTTSSSGQQEAESAATDESKNIQTSGNDSDGESGGKGKNEEAENSAIANPYSCLTGAWGVHRKGQRHADLHVLWLVFKDGFIPESPKVSLSEHPPPSGGGGNGGNGGGGISSEQTDVNGGQSSDESLNTRQTFDGGDDGSATATTKEHHDGSKASSQQSSSGSSASNNNNEFVDGLDDIDNFFEDVEAPDELDVTGDSGSSMQEVVMGTGTRILIKRVSGVWQSTCKLVGGVRDRIVHRFKRNDNDEEDEDEDDDGDHSFTLIQKEDLQHAVKWIRESSVRLFHTVEQVVDDLFQDDDDGDDDEDDYKLNTSEGAAADGDDVEDRAMKEFLLRHQAMG